MMPTDKVVLLRFGQGSLDSGFQDVSADFWTATKNQQKRYSASLPAAPKITESYVHWQFLYQGLYAQLAWPMRIEMAQGGITQVSDREFSDLCQTLKWHLNTWLGSASFQPIYRILYRDCNPTDSIRLIFETDDLALRKLPWHLWNFFRDYPKAEVVLGAPQWEPIDTNPVLPGQIRVLAILGNSAGLNLAKEQRQLNMLAGAQVKMLVEPTRQLLNETLWDAMGWDILFFAGHSYTEAETGWLHLNDQEQLSVEDLRYALRVAIANRLQIAIFNSCDGLGLAQQLADLHIPQVIVMREPVLDVAAQQFLQYFLEAFSEGHSLHLSVRQAREKLQGLEGQFPCASWLPVLCQNPAIAPPTWSTLRPQPTVTRPILPVLRSILASSLFVTTIVMGIRWLGALEGWELAAYDHLLHSRPAETIDSDILVVDITEADTHINQYQHPIKDHVVSEMITTLASYQPQAIGLDLHRQQTWGQGRSELIHQFSRHSNLFIVCSQISLGHAPPAGLTQAQQIQQVGFSDLLIDPFDKKVRRQLLSYAPRLSEQASSKCITPYSFSLQLANHFLAAQNIQVTVNQAQKSWQLGDVVLPRLSKRFGGYQNLHSASNQILINYRQSQSPTKRVTLTQVLAGEVGADEIRDRIILVGYTAPIASDEFNTPFGPMTGIWIHAHMLSQLRSAVQEQRPQIWVLPQWGELQWGDWLWCLIWSSLGGILVWGLKSHPKWVLELSLAGTVGLLYIVCRIILNQGGWMPLLPAAIGIITVRNSLFITSINQTHFHQKNTRQAQEQLQ